MCAVCFVLNTLLSDLGDRPGLERTGVERLSSDFVDYWSSEEPVTEMFILPKNGQKDNSIHSRAQKGTKTAHSRKILC